MFGVKHIVALIISILYIVGGYFLIRKLKQKTVISIALGIGIVSEIVKIFSYIIANEEKLGGFLPKTDLPFHLCSIQIIFLLILILVKHEGIKRVLISFMIPTCLLGGIIALFLPTNSALNMWPITIQYFLYHSSIAIFALRFLLDKEYKLTIKDYIHCLEVFLVVFFFAIYINSIVNDGESKINFMYVVNPPMDGLPYLNKNGGWLAYILKYIALVLVLATLVYIVPIIKFFKGLALKSKQEKTEIENKEVNTDTQNIQE